jgi:hypothetical protein
MTEHDAVTRTTVQGTDLYVGTDCVIGEDEVERALLIREYQWLAREAKSDGVRAELMDESKRLQYDVTISGSSCQERHALLLAVINAVKDSEDL